MKTFYETRKLTLEYHDDLNPKLWDGDCLKVPVRKHLVKIATAWMEFANIPNRAVRDIVITGGNVNYNYTPLSDIDVHLIVDMDKMPVLDHSIMTGIIFDKKALWAANHDIKVEGYPVELFAQDKDEVTPMSQGVFSLIHNKWIVHPNNLHLTYDNDIGLQSKIGQYEQMIGNIVNKRGSLVKAKDLKEKLNQLRSAGLQRAGEFSIENLVYKDLRNSGYIDKLSSYAKNKQDKSLSL
jgi:hypothetical protein